MLPLVFANSSERNGANCKSASPVHLRTATTAISKGHSPPDGSHNLRGRLFRPDLGGSSLRTKCQTLEEKGEEIQCKNKICFENKNQHKNGNIAIFSRMVYAHEIILSYLNIFAIKSEFWRNASTSTQLTTLQKLMQFSFAGFLPQPRHCGSMNLWKP